MLDASQRAAAAIKQGASDLTAVDKNAGAGESRLAALSAQDHLRSLGMGPAPSAREEDCGKIGSKSLVFYGQCAICATLPSLQLDARADPHEQRGTA